jgi:hypothetical protein
LNASIDQFENVTIEYDLKAPFKELVEIKKASPKTGFFKTWCPQVRQLSNCPS